MTVIQESIVSAIKDPNLFRPFLGDDLTSWRSWMTALRVLHGLPVRSKRGRKLIRSCTGRDPAKLPSNGFDQALFLTGRRSGKSRTAAIVAAHAACLSGMERRLAAGEKGIVPIICPTKRQGEICRGYLRAVFEAPMLRDMVVRDRAYDSFTLTNGVQIEILPGDYRHVRGYTVLTAIVDEIAFFGVDEGSKVRSDTELIRAVLPSLSTVRGRLICIGSPYMRKGWCWNTYQKCYGNDSASTLVWNAPSRTMNPTLRQSVVDKAKKEDLAAALSEYMGQFRDDVAQFIPEELIENLVVRGRLENLKDNHQYQAFADLSGGRNDSAALAIGHREGRKVIHDALWRWPAPHNPHQVIAEMCALLKTWGLHRVTTDHYAADFADSAFSGHGVMARKCDKPKSQLYTELLHILTSGEIELLDHPAMLRELCSLERRTRSGGKDIIDHPPKGHDDQINAVAGMAVMCSAKRKVAGAGGF